MANTLIFAGQTITDDHLFGGVSYLADINAGEEFTIGNTASASVSFVTDIRLPIYTKDSENGTFSRTEGNEENVVDNSDNLLVTDDNALFAIETPRGQFYITEVTKSDGFYTITAYDAMILLETNISALSLTFPLTVSAAASAIATYIGCTVLGTIYNGTASVSELDEDMTIRELLSYVAEASGSSVRIDESGHLCFMYYEDSGIVLPASEYRKIEVADYTCSAIDNVKILNSVGATIATAGEGTNTLYVSGNPFLENATDTEAEAILDRVSDLEYAPVVCDLFEENDLKIGTIATFGTTPTLVMHIESSEEGVIVSSVGSDSRAEYNKSFETMIAVASTTATKYITAIDDEGIKVHAESNVNSNYAKIDGDGLEVYKDGDSVAMYGDTSRVGKEGENHIIVSDSDTSFYSDDIKLGSLEIFNNQDVSNGLALKGGDVCVVGDNSVNLYGGTSLDKPITIAGSSVSIAGGSGNDRASVSVGSTVQATGKVYATEFYSGFHSSPIGTVKYATPSADVTVQDNTDTAICSIELEAGVWLLIGSVRWESNTVGYRKINLYTTSGASDVHMTQTPTNGNVTQMVFPRIYEVSSTTTYYLNGLQNSGRPLKAIAGGQNWGSYITAVRIA